MRLFIVACLVVAAICLPKNADFGINFQGSEHPVVNLPYGLRQQNWGSGSCVIASTCSLLRWQGKPQTAAKLRSRYEGGQTFWSWNQILDAEGIRYACTYGANNVRFLEQAIATRRGCIVTVRGGAHMVCLVDMTPTKVCILDNNSTDRLIWRDREDFLQEWYGANSWALTPVYVPASPRIK